MPIFRLCLYLEHLKSLENVFIKKSKYPGRETTDKLKRHPTEWEEIPSSYSFNRDTENILKNEHQRTKSPVNK